MAIDPEKRLPEEEYVPEDDAIIGKAFKWSILMIVVLISDSVRTVVNHAKTPLLEPLLSIHTLCVLERSRLEQRCVNGRNDRNSPEAS